MTFKQRLLKSRELVIFIPVLLLVTLAACDNSRAPQTASENTLETTSRTISEAISDHRLYDESQKTTQVADDLSFGKFQSTPTKTASTDHTIHSPNQTPISRVTHLNKSSDTASVMPPADSFGFVLGRTFSADVTQDATQDATQDVIQGSIQASTLGPPTIQNWQWANGVIHDVTLSINSTIQLPRSNIEISSERCGSANAFYSSATAEITLCVELFDLAYQFYSQNLAPEAIQNDGHEEATSDGITLRTSKAVQIAVQNEAQLAAEGFIKFVLLHEMSHAIADQFQLAIYGNTESAADAIANLLVLDLQPHPFRTNEELATTQEQNLRGSASLFAAYLFSTLPEGGFADVHQSGINRSGDLVCWAIGGNPDLATSFSAQNINQAFIDSGRDCVGEYADQRIAANRWMSSSSAPISGLNESHEQPTENHIQIEKYNSYTLSAEKKALQIILKRMGGHLTTELHPSPIVDLKKYFGRL